MQQYSKSIQAEWLKLKNSGMIWLCLASSLFIPALMTLATFFSGNEFDGPATSNPWDQFIGRIFAGFAAFFYPVFLVLIIVRLTQIEFRHGGWKLIETQPIKRLWLYLAKFNIATVLSAFILLGVLMFSFAGGGLLALIKPQLGFGHFFPELLPVFKFMFRLWIAALGLIAVQYVLSIWINNFALTFGIGLISTIAGSIMAGFGVADWFPYGAPSFTLTSEEGSQTGSLFLHHEWQSILTAILVLWIGYQFFYYKGWLNAFFKPIRKSLSLLVPAIVFAVVMWWINKPVQLKPYGKTVICGTVTGGKDSLNLVFYSGPLRDSLITIPVRNRKFHLQVDKKIEPAVYSFRYGTFGSEVFFGTNDSVNLEIKIRDKQGSVLVKGTRVAENSYLSGNDEQGGAAYRLQNMAYEMRPAEYANFVLSTWKDLESKLEKFKTVDNIKPADDFISTRKKLLAVNYARFLDIVYPKTFAVYYPNDTLKFPDKISLIKKDININDESLLPYQPYREYVSEYHRMKSKAFTVRSDSTYFSYIRDSVPKGKIRDAMIYDQLSKSFSQIADSGRRSTLLSFVSPLIEQEAIRKKLEENNTTLNRLQRGKPAINFIAEAMNGNAIQLNDLRGRYVLIDVWATWCAPCKQEDPYFEQLADQYAGEKIAFVGLSIDQDKFRWKAEAYYKSKRVLQLWIGPEQPFTKEYNLEFIPRYMLIDPKGKIISTQMPRPSDPELEAILQKETGM